MKLTIEQKVIITGYTGVLCCPFSLFHAEVENRAGRPVWTHEFAGEAGKELTQPLFREDFMEMIS